MLTAQQQSKRFTRKCTALRLAEKACTIVGLAALLGAMPVHLFFTGGPRLRAYTMTVTICVFGSGFVILLLGVIVCQLRITMMNGAIESDDISKVAILIDMYAMYASYDGVLRDPNRRLAARVNRIAYAIGQMLPELTGEDGALLDPAQHRTLRAMLGRSEPHVVRSVLHAFSKLGDAEDLTAIEAALARPSGSVRRADLTKDFENAAASICARIPQVTVSSGLLRGSEIPVTENKELLRPSVESDDKHEDELLRSIGSGELKVRSRNYE